MDQDYDDVIAAIHFDDQGLVPVIAQQHDKGEVLMVAWMNRAAVVETLNTRMAVYWSRSRQELWRKGNISGQTQTIIDLRIDCDGDTILLLVDQKGVACHTGRRSCFFTSIIDGQETVLNTPQIDPKVLYP
tara:strand:- start:500 stop:892 length:393 start_codon:yes stop_codon:yes gene_type:complete